METWRDVPGYEKCYQVSNLGRIKSLKRMVLSNKGFEMPKPELIRKGTITKQGYIEIRLSKDGKKKCFKVHRLVLSAFCPSDNPKLECNHKDGNKQNNRIENLEWVTPSQNSLHAHRVLKAKNNRGTNNPRAKLTPLKVAEIKRLYFDTGLTQTELANKFGVVQTQISRIILNRAWKEEQNAY